MSHPQLPMPAKLVIGLFMKEKQRLEQITRILIREHGDLDMVSPWLDFDYTTYYTREMGTPLYRRMLVFKNLVDPGDLAAIKLRTHAIEQAFLDNGNRQVNIDPGYLVLERFVLATGKNFTHRIYIGRGIYADLTLIFQKGVFSTLPWTYPDYADKKMLAFLQKVRHKYSIDLKQHNCEP